MVLLGVWACSAIFRSEEDRLSDRVDEARDALVGGDDAGFLDFFDPGVTYREDSDHATLVKDLAQWRKYKLRHATILTRDIAIQGDKAKIRLQVSVGPTVLNARVVNVVIDAVRRDDTWRVAHFDWSR